MRILTLIVLVITFFVSTQKIMSQNAEVTITESKQFTIEAIFDLIKLKTNYQFIYRYDVVKNSKTVFINKGIYRVQNLLNKCLLKTTLVYDFENNTIIIKKKPKKIILGQVTHLGKPIVDVHVINRNSNKGLKTNKNGDYKLQAEVGHLVKFSHIGFKPIEIIIEDVTQILNIELAENTNELKETIIIAKKTEGLKIHEKLEREINTSIGKLNPMLFPSKVHYFDGENLRNYSSITEALRWRMFETIPSIFDVDGYIHNNPEAIPMNRILDVYVITGSEGTMRWGGPVVIVKTLDAPEEVAKRREATAEKHRNQNFYKEDAQSISKSEVIVLNDSDTNNSNDYKTIFGTITTDGFPLADVNIKVLKTPTGTKTDAKGAYTLKTRIGDEIRYSYLGMHSVNVIIEDVTAQININMVPKTNTLGDVVIITKNSQGQVIERSKKANKSLQTSRGTYNPLTSGASIGYINGDKINLALYSTVKEAIRGQISGFSIKNGKGYLRGDNASVTQDYPVGWEVDGVFTSEEPIALDLTQIKNIHALKGLSATTKYGTLGAGGVIIITTKMGDFSNDKRKAITNEYTNKNYYSNDAVALNSKNTNSKSIELLKQYTNRAYAYQFYKEQLKNTLGSYYEHIDIAKFFMTHFNDKAKAKEILIELSKLHHKNPETLKAIAYYLQAMGSTKKAVNAYQQILNLRPNYAQSYRDLANAFKENNQFKRSWRIYMNYLLNGHEGNGEGIGQVVYNEMEYLYFNRYSHTQIKERFTPKSESLKEFRNDVRFIVEWNTSEAEFDIEFVGPDKRAYVFEHSLVKNQELIHDEKRKGYSCKEFFIEDIGTGEWLINLTYNGNKKYDPTYFKITTYYHWGKPNQKRDVKVYKLQNERHKIQLLKINKNLLFATNNPILTNQN